jgi:hypothetical protein
VHEKGRDWPTSWPGLAEQGRGHRRASNVASTKAATEAKGREMAFERKTEHKIQNQNRQIKERNRYGGDPYSPKG